MAVIYGIKNKTTGFIYIGKTINVKNRFTRHKTQLKHNKHKNIHLQRSYNKHGAECFEYFVIESCGIEELHLREQYWIDYYKDTIYNQEKYVLDDIGIHNSFFGKHHTSETKKKMSVLKQTVYIGPNNPNFGNKQPLKVRLKMVENNSGTILTEVDIPIIADLLRNGVPHKDIAIRFHVSRTQITRISNGTRWQNITGGPVVPVVYQDGIRQFSKNHREKIGAAKRNGKSTIRI